MTNASRNTAKTGKCFEYWCHHLLDERGYNVDEQISIGLRPHGGEHNVDLIVNHEDDTRDIISLKYQEVQGTAEEKIPYEQDCLQHACETYGYNSAYIVLAGDGWTHRDAYIGGAFDKWHITPNVKVIDYDMFIGIYK
mgnify:FL=1|tara:strand:- start:804 stop:1217 length:414 start_codon:yes stop_codon:yes gene_type:complete